MNKFLVVADNGLHTLHYQDIWHDGSAIECVCYKYWEYYELVAIWDEHVPCFKRGAQWEVLINVARVEHASVLVKCFCAFHASGHESLERFGGENFAPRLVLNYDIEVFNCLHPFSMALRQV